ncbi:MAG: flavodoxin family protein [Candidatus Hydrogenedentes bacterium]|nr:flavodoxin family protein [Candidatus Hydrogenedentota bacterium]
MIETTVVGISFSPRSESTEYTVKRALAAAQRVPDTTVKFVSTKGKKIGHCIDCGACLRNNSHCVLQDDFLEILEVYTSGDGIVVGSPVYGMNGSPTMYCFHSRLRSYFSKPGKADEFYYKVGGAIAVGGSRHGGQEMVLLAIRNYYLAASMMVVGGPLHNYSGAAVWSDDGGAIGAEQDTIGMEKAEKLGYSVAVAAKISRIGKDAFLTDGTALSI